MLRKLIPATLVLLVLPLASAQGQVRIGVGAGVPYYRPYPSSYYGLSNGRFVRTYNGPYYWGYVGIPVVPGFTYVQPTPSAVYVQPSPASWYVQPSFVPAYGQLAPDTMYVQPNFAQPAAPSVPASPVPQSTP